ncbi:EamA family transporter [Embleya sp. NBC_00896]|uniref:EamA family transporter n=1 Tax=Embleya sp. NBC_00896 TaxID=2975961 RepID=UPI00386F9714|nr:DMT family transporter [Embleya sp. NBC_00896]
MTPAVTAAVLGSAGLHAAWNALAHGLKDRLGTMIMIQVGGLCLGLACLPFVGIPAAGAWPWLLGSAALHTAYNLLLLEAYRLGDFGQVYPIARGTSPWLTALIGVTLLHEYLTATQTVGVVVISIGMLVLALAGGIPGRAEAAAVLAALATGGAIALYTVLDGVGARSAGSAMSYAAWLFVLESAPTIVVLHYRRGPDPERNPQRVWGLLGGAMSVVAYTLVIWAQTRGTLATIAALRESSVVIGAIIGTVVFHETYGRHRIAATVLVLGGIVAINLP